jgi:prephenate dehydrogenase
MKTVGIIGFGSFGRFLAEKLSSHAKVYVYSASGKANSWTASLEEIAACDFIVPAIPLESYESAFNELSGHISPESVIVDVCSVKVKPLQIIKRILPQQPTLATHPMFGPESASVSLAGHTIVM